jgi:hypothetical protein
LFVCLFVCMCGSFLVCFVFVFSALSNTT